jgi:hypothetical protein
VNVCYYAFLNKVPLGFKSRYYVTERARENIENDADLQAMLRNMKKTRGSSRTSSTPKSIKDESFISFMQ